MAKMKLSHLLAKVPAAEINIINISFELHDQLGWAIIEGELVVGNDSTETAINITIPVQLTVKELSALFDVVKVEGAPRRRRVRK